jgi:hypothetical protein
MLGSTRRRFEERKMSGLRPFNERLRLLDGLGGDGDGAHTAQEQILIPDIARRGELFAGPSSLALKKQEF